MPIKVRRIRKVFLVQIESLAKFHEFPELFDQCYAIHAGLSCALQSMWKKSHTGEVIVKGNFQS